MHHLELKVSSVQLWWHPGTARKRGSPSSGWWHLVCHVPGLCSSFLPVKGLSASGAGSIPLARFPLHVSLLEVCLLPHSITAAPFIRLPSTLQNQHQILTNRTLWFQFLNTPAGSHAGGTTLDKACDVTGLYAGSFSFLPQSILLLEVRGRAVSTQHPPCALSRPPAGGGCDGGSGGVSGSGGTCGSAGLQSEAGCPGPSRHHGSLHPPQLTKGHCCMEGSHCLPAGSWCCTHDHFRFPSGPSSVASFPGCVRVAP